MALGVCERRAADEVRRRLDRLREAFNLQRQLGGERGQDSRLASAPRADCCTASEKSDVPERSSRDLPRYRHSGQAHWVRVNRAGLLNMTRHRNPQGRAILTLRRTPTRLKGDSPILSCACRVSLRG